MNKPEFYSTYQALKNELVGHMEQWEQLHGELEQLKNKRN